MSAAKVTPDMVKQLRERTGVGMGKCKEALEHVGGDMERAIDHLRKAGIASAVKKEGRETKEGLIGFAIGKQAVALVEVNAETDFVVKNELLQQFVRDLCEEAASGKSASVDALMQAPYHKDKTLTLDAYRASIIQSLGENIRVKRLLLLPKGSDISIGVYSHMGGKIVTAVVLSGASGFEELARAIGMHVAAESPEYLRSSDVPEEVRARETDIAKGQVQGKPANVIDKIIEGKLKAFYDMSCLLSQKYIRDTNITIEQFVAAEAKKSGKPLAVQSFVRWQVGA